jgi:hypothetical protein
VIKFLRDKSVLTVAAIVLFFLLFHWHLFTSPVAFDTQTKLGFLPVLLSKYIAPLPNVLLVFIYTALVLQQAFRLNYILNNSKMFLKQGFTTAFAYIVLSSFLLDGYLLSASLIANSFIIWLYNSVTKLYNNNSPRGLLFSIGFFTTCSVILYHPTALLFVTIFFALAIVRPFKISEWLILLLGVIAPIYLLLSGLFLTNNFIAAKQMIPKFTFNTFAISKNYLVWFTGSLLAFLLILGFSNWYPNSNRMVIQIRKNWSVMLVLLLFSIPSIFIFYKDGLMPAILCYVPLAAFISNYFLYTKKLLIANLIILLSIAVIILNYWR